MGAFDAEFKKSIEKLLERVMRLEDRVGTGIPTCEHGVRLGDCSDCTKHEDGAAEVIWERAEKGESK